MTEHQIDLPTWFGLPVRTEDCYYNGTVKIILPTGEELIVRTSEVIVKGGCNGYQG